MTTKTPIPAIVPLWRRHPRLLAFVGLLLVASFATGLRWGLYTPLSSVAMISYTSLEQGQTEAFAPVDAVLMPQGRFAVLTVHAGYRGMLLEATTRDSIFELVNRGSHAWADQYPSSSTSSSGLLTLTNADGTSRIIRIASPDTNTTLPRDLRGLLSAITRWQVETVRSAPPITQLPLRLVAIPVVSAPAAAPIYDIPRGIKLDFGVMQSPAGAPLAWNAPIVAAWQLDELLLPHANERIIRSDGHLYHLATLVDWLSVAGLR